MPDYMLTAVTIILMLCASAMWLRFVTHRRDRSRAVLLVPVLLMLTAVALIVVRYCFN